MSDDTRSNSRPDVLRAELRALSKQMDAGFGELKDALAAHGQAQDRLTERVHNLELKNAREEGSNFEARLVALSGRNEKLKNKVSDLEKWRWYMAGIFASLLFVAGVALKLI